MFEPSVIFVDEPLLDVDVDAVADSSVGQWLAALEAWGPSASSLGVLTSLDPAVLSRDDRETFLLLVDRHVAWLEAVRLSAMLAVAGEEPDDDDTGREDVAVLIGLSPDAAQRRIDTARAVHTRLPLTQEALARGAISPLHVLAISEATEGLSDQDAAAVEKRVFPRAETQTLAEFRRALKRAVARVCPISLEVAHAAAASQRTVSMWAEPDGMARLEAYLPAADAQTVWLAVDALARANGTTSGCSGAEGGDRSGGEPDPVTGRRPPIDARRADALVAMASAVLADPSLPKRHGRPVTVNVVVDLPTLLHLAEHPGELVGHGPIPASVARQLAGDAAWRRWVADPVSGHLLDFGRTTYTPPQVLRDYVIARDGSCRFPGCPRPAHLGDLDHAEPFAAGGSTSAANLAVLCRRHHRMKTHHDWGLRHKPDGTSIWTSPTGRRYDVPPRPVLEPSRAPWPDD